MKLCRGFAPMTEADEAIDPIVNYLSDKRSVDFSGYCPDVIARRLRTRMAATACRDFSEYLSYLQHNADELDRLVDVITVNVSRFFRDALTFELIADRVLPDIVRRKAEMRDQSLRVWSAGCARGEEPYSLAILIQELLEKAGRSVNLLLFATDISQASLEEAETALYPLSSVEDVKYRLLMKYFTREGTSFRLVPEISAKVRFSRYDMLDKGHGVPPQSVFGDFDMVLCRNLLMYLNREYQERIFDRLHRALARQGYLVLGEVEEPAAISRHRFNRVFDSSPIYRKG
jgi:chemotaxis protein methyltransferase CheR